MHVLYNEWDEPTAAWLRELIDGRHLPSGSVDTRSIGDVRADDLRDFDQCHFFAGIGGWPLALRWAGLEGTSGVWTGSPPCQPFSVAGKGLGQADERHLAPVWLDLIREQKPVLIFGEQVEAAIRVGWLDDLFDALEGCGYACGAAVLPACSVGAPHIRKRLFFGAVRLADAYGWSSSNGDVQSGREHGLFPQGRSPVRKGCEGPRAQSDRLADADENRFRARREIRSVRSEHDAEHGGATCWVADAPSLGRIGRRTSQASDEPGSVERPDGLRDVGGLADPGNTRPQGRAGMPECAAEQPAWPGRVEGGPADPHHGFWSGADWLGCRDGKFRPVEPGTQPLAHGLSARVGRLRGYGNAIVPQVAAQFITEFLGAIADMQDEGLTP
ncbi:DNA cytosine methyltransferase [Asaia spathodeae]|uniref:DNA (cytosine-5-)-methyltransferase n=1 Tax=Asaia spathodeae TaxID=657016 RepID=A0ABX2P6B7_9PROT